jgi:sugar phosphate isomerase/epimerase
MKRIVISDGGNILEISKFCERNDFGVNIDRFCEPDYLENNPDSIKEHLEVYKNVDICSIHGPLYDLNFGSKDPLIREVTLKRYEYAYEISCKLKCKNIILHNGYVPGTSFHLNWVERAKTFWNNFLANKAGETVFYIENLLEHDPEIIVDVINSVDNKCLRMCFDIGHANVFSKVKITEWIKKLNKNIGFVHMHNNYGEKDEHNGINNGNINMVEICDALEQFSPEAIWDLETKEYKESIKWFMENKYVK